MRLSPNSVDIFAAHRTLLRNRLVVFRRMMSLGQQLSRRACLSAVLVSCATDLLSWSRDVPVVS